MAHSCFTQSVDAFFEGKNPALRVLYDAYLQLIESVCGPVIVNVNKTRISFQARTRFAAVPGMTKDTLICHVWLKKRIESPRFTRIEFIPPNNYVCQFRIKDVAELDDEVASWIAEAYHVGMQEA
jgi:hypothetical protein